MHYLCLYSIIETNHMLPPYPNPIKWYTDFCVSERKLEMFGWIQHLLCRDLLISCWNLTEYLCRSSTSWGYMLPWDFATLLQMLMTLYLPILQVLRDLHTSGNLLYLESEWHGLKWKIYPDCLALARCKFLPHLSNGDSNVTYYIGLFEGY